MGKLMVIEIDITYRTLFSDAGSKFTRDSKEYVIVELDHNDRQIGVVDYGYPSRSDAERVCRTLTETTG